MAKYLTVNADKKTLTIDRTVTPTNDELEDVKLYLSTGYVIRHKSEAKVARGKKLAQTLKSKKSTEK